jgi:PAS domain-containing protein
LPTTEFTGDDPIGHVRRAQLVQFKLRHYRRGMLEVAQVLCHGARSDCSTARKFVDAARSDGDADPLPQGNWREGQCYVLDSPSLEPPLLRDVFAYWQRKRGGRSMPARRDVDPHELRAHLPHLFLMDVVVDDFRYRLLGSAITERYGRDGTGELVSEAYAELPTIREWYLAVLRAVVSGKRPMLTSAPMRAVQKEFILVQALHLPLSDDDSGVNMILGAAHFSAQKPPGELLKYRSP